MYKPSTKKMYVRLFIQAYNLTDKKVDCPKLCGSMNSFKDASISSHPMCSSQASALEEHDCVVIDHNEKNYLMKERRLPSNDGTNDCCFLVSKITDTLLPSMYLIPTHPKKTKIICTRNFRLFACTFGLRTKKSIHVFLKDVKRWDIIKMFNKDIPGSNFIRKKDMHVSI